MIENVLRDIGGVGIYGVISVCLFCAVFAAAILWACAQKQSLLNKMSTMPLEEAEIKKEEIHE